ncbi:hypothetical protein A45J_1867 [hot springs metagenome]|uniref:Uncharacterized protein n=1 Tax=hot springs metagenome TaxID=433727 RepID=A0A5J4L7H3_9ZZZZ
MSDLDKAIKAAVLRVANRLQPSPRAMPYASRKNSPQLP